MAFILALIYFVLCVLNLIYNVFIEKYQSGLEALMGYGNNSNWNLSVVVCYVR